MALAASDGQIVFGNSRFESSLSRCGFTKSNENMVAAMSGFYP
jgi:hypothetical protein